MHELFVGTKKTAFNKRVSVKRGFNLFRFSACAGESQGYCYVLDEMPLSLLKPVKIYRHLLTL